MFWLEKGMFSAGLAVTKMQAVAFSGDILLNIGASDAAPVSTELEFFVGYAQYVHEVRICMLCIKSEFARYGEDGPWTARTASTRQIHTR